MRPDVREALFRVGEPDILHALDTLARYCMRAVCADDPDACDHPVQLMTPLEWVGWIQTELHRVGPRGHTQAARDHMSAAKLRASRPEPRRPQRLESVPA